MNEKHPVISLSYMYATVKVCHITTTRNVSQMILRSRLFTAALYIKYEDNDRREKSENQKGVDQVSILYKSIAGRYRPIRVADGPITARCRCIKNASWGVFHLSAITTGFMSLYIIF